MTSRPALRARRCPPAEALAECRRLAGAQFWPECVALERLVAAGALPAAAGATRPACIQSSSPLALAPSEAREKSAKTMPMMNGR